MRQYYNRKQGKSNATYALFLFIFLLVVVLVLLIGGKVKAQTTFPYIINVPDPIDYWSAFDSSTGGDGYIFIASSTAEVNQVRVPMCRLFDYSSDHYVWANIASWVNPNYYVLGTSTQYGLQNLPYYSTRGQDCATNTALFSFNFGEDIPVYEGTDYVVMFNTSTTSNEQVIVARNTDNYFDMVQQCVNGVCSYNTTKEPYVVVNTTQFVSTGIEQWEVLDEYIPDFSAPIDQVCFLGEDCNVWFYYNEFMIGEELRLVSEPEDEWLDDVIIPNRYDMEYYLTYPALEGSERVIEYNLFSPVCYELFVDGIDFSGCGILNGSYQLTWVASSTYLPDMSIFDENPCIGIQSATSSIEYGIRCAFRRFFNWLGTPRSEVYRELGNEASAFTRNFPMNWYFHFYQTFDDLRSTTTYSAVTIPLFWWWDEDSDSLELQASGEVSTTTIQTLVDEDTYNRFYGYMQYFLMFFGALYFILRVAQMSRSGSPNQA